MAHPRYNHALSLLAVVWVALSHSHREKPTIMNDSGKSPWHPKAYSEGINVWRARSPAAPKIIIIQGSGEAPFAIAVQVTCSVIRSLLP